jgi:hypothetical protein
MVTASEPGGAAPLDPGRVPETVIMQKEKYMEGK